MTRTIAAIRTVTHVSALLLLVAPLGSGCILSTRQEVFVAAPLHPDLVFFGGYFTFDLTTSPRWIDQHGKVVRIRDLAIVGDFSNATGGPFGGGPAPIDVKIDVGPDSSVILPSGIDVWGPLHLEVGERKRIDWPAGERMMLPGASTLEHELRGDGKFILYMVPTVPTIGGVQVGNLRLVAVFELK